MANNRKLNCYHVNYKFKKQKHYRLEYCAHCIKKKSVRKRFIY